MEVAAFGRYDGVAFTADWVDEYPGLTETGHIVVDLDETNMYVTRFEFTTEWDADDGSLERYGAVGPGTRCVLGFDETHFHCESDEDVAAESVQVTWLQNPPVADSGLYYYDLISASDFHIVIDLIQQEASPGTGVPIG